MQSSKILVGKFYTLRSGLVVRIAEKGGRDARSRLRAGCLSVWSKEGQEPFTVRARDVVAEAADPTPVVTSLAALVATAPKGAKVVWASRCTAWDVYPQKEPVQLAAHAADGWYLPMLNGLWFKNPCGMNTCSEVLGSVDGTWKQNGTRQQYCK